MNTVMRVGAEASVPVASEKLYWLEALRGIAAIWVLLHHAAQSTDAFIGSLGQVHFLENGYLGVDFFFVLSGFIIAYSAKSLQARGGRAAHYLSLRALRVYVPYLPVGVGILMLYLAFPGVSRSDREISFVTSITLLPDFNPPALSVAWTLVHELIFYTVFVAWFYSKRLLYAILALWLCLIVLMHVGDISSNRFIDYFVSPLNVCFILGVAVYSFNERLRQRSALCIAVMLLGLLIIADQSTAMEVNRVATAVAFALVILGVTSDFARSFRPTNVFVVLGAASYSIYLVHNPALSILSRAWTKLELVATPWAGFWTISLCALLAGLIYWRIYETPALRLARSIFGRAASSR